MRRAAGSRRAATIGVAASIAAALALAACSAPSSSSGGTGRSPVAHNTTVAPTGSPSASAPAPSAVITTTPAPGAGPISPATPVKVGIAHGTLTGVIMTNPEGEKVSGTFATDGSSWHSTEDLGYAKTYKITAAGKDTDGMPVRKHASVTTLTPNNQTLPYIWDIYGHDIGHGNTYGVGMVVRMHFDEVVNEKKAERRLSVTTTPHVTGSWYWEDSQDAYWRPKSYYPPGTKVSVAAMVYGHDVGNGLYGQADQRASFVIGADHRSVANAKTHHVKVYFGGKLMRTMPTSMGMGGTVRGKDGQKIYLWTMPGVYTVINHENPATMSSDSFGLPANSPLGYAPEKVPWATKISVDGIYLHELDTTLSEQGHSNVSHGCLNLNERNAKWFYKHSNVGDVVKVIHSGGPKIQVWQGGEWSVPWAQWAAGSALN